MCHCLLPPVSLWSLAPRSLLDGKDRGRKTVEVIQLVKLLPFESLGALLFYFILTKDNFLTEGAFRIKTGVILPPFPQPVTRIKETILKYCQF